AGDIQVGSEAVVEIIVFDAGIAGEPGLDSVGPATAARIVHVNGCVADHIQLALDDNQPGRGPAVIQLAARHDQFGEHIGSNRQVGFEANFTLRSAGGIVDEYT